MGKKLVIVESPAKARTINKYLGKGYKVEASMGHIRDLPSSKFGVDIENGFEPSYAIIKRAQKTVTKLKKLAKEMDSVYLAPDPDREGEAISWHLQEILREVNPNIFRVTFNEITKASILKAFDKPREVDTDLVDSQQARRILDRIVGYRISPLLWKKVAKGLSAGRVQTVALRLIIDREREINAFTPEEYWQIKAQLTSPKEENDGKMLVAKLDKISGKKAELAKEEKVTKIVSEIDKQPFTVTKVEAKKKQRKPQAPYTTSKLQQEAYTRLKYPAQKTMRIAQRLYEGIDIGGDDIEGLITYMRTDSVAVSKDATAAIRTIIKETYGDDHLPGTANQYKSKKSAQEAHEAIRPTLPLMSPASVKEYLQDEEYKLYDLIWKKFVSSQMVNAVDNVTTVLLDVREKYQFRATGTCNIFKGFLACYEIETQTDNGDDKEQQDNGKENQDMPTVVVGDVMDLLKLIHTQHFTKPPARFNDASLVKTLEELGIGRPSTYAPTIMTIMGRNYVERKSGALHPTEMGGIVVDLLVKNFETIFDYGFTAAMEENLDKIEEGALQWGKVLSDFYAPFEKQFDIAQERMKNIKKIVITTDYKCEKCGKTMLEKWGRFGKFLACSGFPECRTTAPMPTGVDCPEADCDGTLVKRQSKNRRIFYGCSTYPKCNHVTNKLPKKDDDE